MKFLKYLCTLVFAFCAFTSISKAQSVQFLGGGSSALFQELGAGSVHITGGAGGNVTCLWSFGSTSNPSGTPYIAFRDNRTGVVLDENGKIFIAWSTGTGSNGNGAASCTNPTTNSQIYAYISLDSVVGDRCFFINDNSGAKGCLLVL